VTFQSSDLLKLSQTFRLSPPIKWAIRDSPPSLRHSRCSPLSWLTKKRPAVNQLVMCRITTRSGLVRLLFLFLLINCDQSILFVDHPKLFPGSGNSVCVRVCMCVYIDCAKRRSQCPSPSDALSEIQCQVQGLSPSCLQH
jgi:hypothetical protein